MIKCLSTTMLGRNVHGIGTLIMGLVLAGLVLLNTLDRAGATTTPPQGPTTLVIQKFQHPEQQQHAGSGLPLDASQIAELTPVAGVEFSVSKVSDVDVTTEQGRAAANEMTVGQAAQQTDELTAHGTTNSDGELVFSDLDAGLYVVEETAAPTGVVTTDPFLVMLPMPHPTQDSWLQTVYVYPKNSAVDISLSVVDEATIQIGDAIDWRIAADIPKQSSLATYRIRNSFAAGISPDQPLEDVAVALSTGTSTLQTDRDYHLEAHQQDGYDGFELTFTKTGRAKLLEARQQDPTAQLTVGYTAPAASSGSHTNTVELQVDDADPITDTATTQLGVVEGVVHERDRPEHRIKDAVFELYLDAEDAVAGRNPVPSSDNTTQWHTDAHGTFTIDGLRLTNFVNGLEHDRHDPLYRLYYLKAVEYPTGWTGEMEPVAVALTSADEPHQLTFEVVSSDNQAAASGGDDSSQDLASTGPRIAGLVLVALIFIAVGIFALRRRQHRRRPTV